MLLLSDLFSSAAVGVPTRLSVTVARTLSVLFMIPIVFYTNFLTDVCRFVFQMEEHGHQIYK